MSMTFTLQSSDISRYLEQTDIIDYLNPAIQNLAKKLTADSVTATAKAMYEYVRDEISHTFDIGASQVAVTASDVLRLGHGICFAKSHLLAALLRSAGIPAGFCYQKLIYDDVYDRRLILHGLNAVYLKRENRWIRLDARGNKSSVNAQFDLNTEKLAFPVREELGEADFKMICYQPAKLVVDCLQSSGSAAELLNNLPTEL